MEKTNSLKLRVGEVIGTGFPLYVQVSRIGNLYQILVSDDLKTWRAAQRIEVAFFKSVFDEH